MWLFLFLLFNRKEGIRLFETLIEEVKTLEKTYQQVIENLKKSDAIMGIGKIESRESGGAV